MNESFLISDLEFLQLCPDSCHVFDERIEVRHVEIHRFEPLEEALVVTEELFPTSVESSDRRLVLSEAAQ